MAALDARRLAGDFGFAIVAQVAAMVVGFANALLLPKLFSEATYGYWQLFLFYASYAGIFGVGLVDGVYLIHGGERRAEVDKRLVNSEFWCCAAIQLVVGGTLLGLGLSPLFDLDRATVVIGVALYLVFFNLANFLGYVFQAIGETRRYSASTIVESLVFLALLLILMLAGVASFSPYVAFYVLARAARLGYCALYARDFLRAGLLSLSRAVRESWQTMRVGVKLLVSNLGGMLIVGSARFVIDIAWPIEEFAVVSLALSLVNFFMTFTSQAAMVLFPALRRIERAELSALFLSLRDGLSLLLPALYVLYVPMVFFLELWLPNYAASFELFAILLPLCIFNGKMDIVGMTMLKVMREEGRLLRINVIACVASVAGALIGGFAVHSIPFILVWIVVCVICRCLWAERFVTARLGLEDGWINLGSVVVTAVCVLAVSFAGPLAAECVVIGAYLAYLVIFRNETAKLLGAARGLRRS